MRLVHQDLPVLPDRGINDAIVVDGSRKGDVHDAVERIGLSGHAHADAGIRLLPAPRRRDAHRQVLLEREERQELFLPLQRELFRRHENQRAHRVLRDQVRPDHGLSKRRRGLEDAVVVGEQLLGGELLLQAKLPLKRCPDRAAALPPVRDLHRNPGLFAAVFQALEQSPRQAYIPVHVLGKAQSAWGVVVRIAHRPVFIELRIREGGHVPELILKPRADVQHIAVDSVGQDYMERSRDIRCRKGIVSLPGLWPHPACHRRKQSLKGPYQHLHGLRRDLLRIQENPPLIRIAVPVFIDKACVSKAHGLSLEGQCDAAAKAPLRIGELVRRRAHAIVAAKDRKIHLSRSLLEKERCKVPRLCRRNGILEEDPDVCSLPGSGALHKAGHAVFLTDKAHRRDFPEERRPLCRRAGLLPAAIVVIEIKNEKSCASVRELRVDRDRIRLFVRLIEEMVFQDLQCQRPKGSCIAVLRAAVLFPSVHGTAPIPPVLALREIPAGFPAYRKNVRPSPEVAAKALHPVVLHVPGKQSPCLIRIVGRRNVFVFLCCLFLLCRKPCLCKALFQNPVFLLECPYFSAQAVEILSLEHGFSFRLHFLCL